MNSNKIGPFNVGNPNELTIKEIAFKIREKINSSSEIIFQNLPEDDPLRRKPDISLITEKLEWKPQINLEEGLDKTIHYFRKILKNNKIK